MSLCYRNERCTWWKFGVRMVEKLEALVGVLEQRIKVLEKQNACNQGNQHCKHGKQHCNHGNKQTTTASIYYCIK